MRSSVLMCVCVHIRRVEGMLAVTRAFGDRRLKKYVTAVPEIETKQLTEHDQFIILASDGTS